MKKYLYFMFALLSLIGCDQFSHNNHQKFSGTLEWTEYSLGTPVSGRISTISVEEGDEVKKNQLIATLDRFDQTKKDLDRTQTLFEQGGATQQQLEIATLSNNDQKIVSPLDGIVLVKVYEIGEIAQPGSPIVVIGDKQDIWVRIYIPEGVINKVSMGQQVEIHFDGLKQTASGSVSYISPKAEFTPRNVQTEEDRVTQTFAVKIRLNEPLANLRPGVAADVFLQAKE